MKKGTPLRLTIEDLSFPAQGLVRYEDRLFQLDGFFPGETVEGTFGGSKKRRSRVYQPVLVEPRPDALKPACEHFGPCGGCISQHLPLCTQRSFKRQVVIDLLRQAELELPDEIAIHGLSQKYDYRNKMEFNFGDSEMGGPLTLGMYQRNHGFNVINTTGCRLIDHDMRLIHNYTIDYFRGIGLPFYRWVSREGFLRHLVIRHTKFGEELMVILVTTTQHTIDLSEWVEGLKQLPLRDKLVSIWHMENDSIANVVQSDRMILLDGKETITEYIHDLRFEISPQAFFQTNSASAELLYSRVLDKMVDVDLALDLYSGTGTITQLIAQRAKRVIGVELVEEAVIAARDSAKKNQIENVEFIAGDVKDVVADFEGKVDLIIVDPPRAGLIKAVEHIVKIAPKQIIYVSCNPKTLAIDLAQMTDYTIEHIELIDMFPNTPHIETIVKLYSKEENKQNDELKEGFLTHSKGEFLR